MTATILYVLGVIVVLFVIEFGRRRKADRWARVIPQQLTERTQAAPRKERKQEERMSAMPVANVAGTLPNAAHR